MKDKNGEIITGSRIYLRPIQMSDTPDILRWRNSDLVVNNFLYRRTVTAEDHERWMSEMVQKGRVIQWIIHTTDTDKPIGSVYLKDIDKENRKCEFGIFIGETGMCGKGYGTEACKMAVQYAFEQLGLAKVYLRLLADNKMAMHTYERVGFITEGVFKMDRWIENHPVDVVFMAKFSKT